VANFDMVFVYDRKVAADLNKRKLVHPGVRRGNRMPTTGDLRWAVDALDNATYDVSPRPDDDEWSVQEANEEYWIRIGGFDWAKPTSIPGESFVIYGGTSRLGIAIVIKLAERCGQLVIWPDSGDPPIIVDGDDDATIVADCYHEFLEQSDEWETYFERMYGPD
jgi:hypothetical protein